MVRFKKVTQTSTYQNPFSEFSEYEGKGEIRWDPLTRMTARLVRFPARSIDRFDYDFDKLHLESMVLTAPEDVARDLRTLW